MIVGEAFFEDEEDSATQSVRGEHSRAEQQNSYVPKQCPPEWFMARQKEEEEEEIGYTLMKFRADLCYYKQHYDEADMWYRKVLQQLPKTHTPIRREVVDSLSRVCLRRGEVREALTWAQELVLPPHESNSSLWQLLGQCHMALNNVEDEVLCLQQSLLHERGFPDHWINLSQSYTRLSCDIRTHKHLDQDKLTTILLQTVSLLRPYYIWKMTNDKRKKTEGEEEEEEEVVLKEGKELEEEVDTHRKDLSHRDKCVTVKVDKETQYVMSEDCQSSGNSVDMSTNIADCEAAVVGVSGAVCVDYPMDPVATLFTDLLMRKQSCTSTVNRCMNKQEEEEVSVEVLCGLFNMADAACLLVARELLKCSLRHSPSFATDSRQRKMVSLHQLLTAHNPAVLDYLSVHLSRYHASY